MGKRQKAREKGRETETMEFKAIQTEKWRNRFKKEKLR